MKNFKPLILCLCLLPVYALFAASSESTLSKKMPKSKEEKKSKPWSVSVSMGMASTVDKPDAYDHSEASSFSISPSYNLPNKFKLKAYLGYRKNMNGLYEDTIQNGFLGVSRKLAKHSDYLSLTGEGRVYFPFDELNRDLDSYRSSINVRTTLSSTFDTFGAKGLSASFTTSYMQNFHEYYLNRAGSPNTMVSLSNTLSISYSFLKKFSVNTYFGNSHAWNYWGRRKTDSFSTGQSLSYSVTDEFSTTIGHSNGRSTFKSNGTDPNIELFSGDTSTVYTNLSYRF